MSRRIDEDHKDFHDVYGGKKHRELKKYIKNGQLFRNRGKDGKLIITIPRIDIPIIVHGGSDGGIGRGEGEDGDVIGRDDGKGKGKGKAGQGEGEGIDISVDLEEVLKFLQDELELPNLKPKPNQTYEEVQIKYNDISLVGPESLRHNRRTLLQAMKRQCADGSINKLHKIPGFAQPIKLISPINSDRRYRQYREIKIPASNAVIFFARDGSASMDQYKCDIVSDMAWWIDAWIRQFYKRVERCYVWHDTVASEVGESKFYKHRYGGGTTCSSALKLIAKQLENRFPPKKWNVYIFYFTDGENWGDDNNTFCKTMQESFPPDVVNLIGITQVLAWGYENSLKYHVDHFTDAWQPSDLNIRTTNIGSEESPDMSNRNSYGMYGTPQLSDKERDTQVRRAIVDLLGKEKV